jgi:T5SS/PEP-CTERM-associated repeat protein
MVTVDGAGSMWANNGDTFVGNSGNGILNIINSGSVSDSVGYIGSNSGSAGTATVTGAGSTWTNNQIIIGEYSGNGLLNISSGGNVSNDNGLIGYFSGSAGTVTVDGAGSAWTNGAWLYVGDSGNGLLNISSGGSVSNVNGNIGFDNGSSGTVTVDGAGSTWTNKDWLYVGNSGNGILSISDGALVSAKTVSCNSASLLSIDVGNGSLLNVNNGSGTLTNNGTVRILAGAKPTAGASFSPISAGTWTGTGTYQPLGGMWDAINHLFTASAVQSGAAGSPVTVDLASIQRIIVNDTGPGGTGWAVGASFAPTTSSNPLSLTATPIDAGLQADLKSQLTPNQAIVNGWTFSIPTGYNPGDPAYLSFSLGSAYAGCSGDDLQVWYYDTSSGWASYNAFDLSCDGQFANFTVSGFGGYALVTVPEPGTLAMLAAGGIFGIIFACKCRKQRCCIK